MQNGESESTRATKGARFVDADENEAPCSGQMPSWRTVFALLLAAALVVSGSGVSGCSGGSPSTTSSNELVAGVCADTCLKACSVDGDCDSSTGEVCCDYGDDGNACVPAIECPRFCSADDDCESSDGEACLRTVATTAQRECTAPSNAIVSCSKDSQCDVDAGEKCCTIYDSPMCLAAELCPSSCSENDDCNSAAGEVCCTSFAATDSALKVDGLCVNPDEEPCPTTCNTSSDCNTSEGEVCCNGTCSTTCEKSCNSSDECPGQVCCKTRAVTSPFRTRPVPGYQVSSGSVSDDTGGTTALETACEQYCATLLDTDCEPGSDCIANCVSDVSDLTTTGCETEGTAYVDCIRLSLEDCAVPEDSCLDEYDTLVSCGE